MNNLALALLQDGIWPKQDHSLSEEVDQNATDSTLKGMYFRQFMPASNAVSLHFVKSHYIIIIFDMFYF